EPLVKKRFALARLAWITYAGPSADRSGLSSPSSTVGGADYDLWLLINKYGVTEDFLRLGTAANIHKYFGLSWVADPDNPSSKLWVYSHQGTAPLTTAGSAPVSTIRTLTGGSNNVSGREADFFELLKASVHAGSMAKSYTTPGDTWAPTWGSFAVKARVYAGTKDADFDSAVVQMGANILSQSSTSGFPVRIMFNNGLFGKIQQYRGVADFPYIYRVREGKVMVKQPIVKPSSGADLTLMENLPRTNATVTDPGRVMGLQEPEIWNPHAWNSIRGDTLFRPTDFRIIALTQDPNGVATTPISIGGGYNYSGAGWRYSQTHATPPVTPIPETLTSVNTEMLFDIKQNFDNLFREPTLLTKPGIPLNSNLRIGSGHTIKSELAADYILTPKKLSWYGYIPGNKVTDNLQYIGVVIARNLPAAFNIPNLGGGSNGNGVLPTGMNFLIAGDGITYRMQYKDPNGNWVTYDEKFAPVNCAYTYPTQSNTSNGQTNTYSWGDLNIGHEWGSTCFDPRTGRFGMILMGKNGPQGGGTIDFPVAVRNAYAVPLNNAYLVGWSIPSPAAGSNQALILPYMQRSANQNTLWTNRPDECAGYVTSTWTNGQGGLASGPGRSDMGWYPRNGQDPTPTGMTCQNNPATSTVTNQVWRFLTDGQLNSPSGLRGFADPDGVMRRGMSAYVTLAAPANPGLGKPASGGATGLPLRTAYVFSADNSGTIQDIGEAASRPVILNRPFRSVAELGYVFSGTPWRNVDFFTPESGNSAFLDVFCVDVNDNEDALTDGRTNLNTRHAPVLRAIMANSYQDAFSPSSTTTRLQAISGSGSADAIARALISRTTDNSTPGAGPLQNISELVGKWNASQAIPTAVAPFNIDGGASYTGFSGTTTTSVAPLATPPNLSSVLVADTSKDGYTACTNQRYRESVIRSLSAGGQMRVWNLMIDVVAQTGVCTENASDLSKFTVKGEQRYWVHVAIDRYTGAILDKQIEVVTE
ncbi:MAG: hypothetical protein ACAI35_22160, partial [Candidatus Methylacidiphilales bacterium]